jgi:quercetin dioxygenase-like cupin family protein
VDPIVLRQGEGRALSVGGNDILLMAKGKDTGNAVGVIDYTAAPGFPGPPRHYHRELTDMFFVLEGTLTFAVGDETVEAPPGTFLLVPPGVVHTFSNQTSEPARFLGLVSPAGFEHYFEELADALGDGALDPEVAAKISAKYDIVVAQ